MEIKKLKLEPFSRIQLINFPDWADPGISTTRSDPEVIIYYIDEIGDVARFVDCVDSAALPSENRTIMVYQKGRKDGVNRDAIFTPFKNGDIRGFKQRAPMLCSLSDRLSAIVFSRIIEV